MIGFVHLSPGNTSTRPPFAGPLLAAGERPLYHDGLEQTCMRIIDLSRPIQSGMPVYPGDPEVKLEVVHDYETHGWLLRSLSLGTHSGTHVDAPAHMHREGATLSNIPLERFIGPACLTQVTADYPCGIGLLFSEQVTHAEFPRIAAAGPPIVGGELDEELERALLGRGIITCTDLVNLDKLPRDARFTFIALPFPLVEGDGSPVRAVAVIDDGSGLGGQ